MPITFNPENKEGLTYGEALEPAMMIEDQEEADAYLKAYVGFIQKALDKEPPGKHTAIEIARINLGYYAGYFGNETQERVKKLFLAKHPIFDSPHS